MTYPFFLDATSRRFQTDWIDWLPSAARTTNQVSSPIDFRGYSGIVLAIRVTAWTVGSLRPIVYSTDYAFLGYGNTFGELGWSYTYFQATTNNIVITNTPRSETKMLIPLSKGMLGIIATTADNITYSTKYQLIP